MLNKKRRNKKLDVFKKMPPLYHVLPGEDFSMKNSQVINWMKDQPILMDYLLSSVQRIGYIKYNPETGLWCGIEYEAPCVHGQDWDDCPDCRH